MTNVTYTGLRPGDVIDSIEQADTLPIGSMVTRFDNPQDRWQKGDAHGNYSEDAAWYNTYNGELLSLNHFRNRINRTGKRWVVESVPVDLGETVEQWAWRLRDIVMYGSERALGSTDDAQAVLRELKVEFTPSVGQRIVNKRDRRHLPKGSRVYVGDPEDRSTFSIWQKSDRRGADGWEKVFGGGKVSPVDALSVIVDVLPGEKGEVTEPEDWLVAKPGKKDAAKIVRLRANVWELGARVKARRSWCPEFERVMIRAGVSEDSAIEPFLGGFRVGDVVTPEQAATLAEGVILSSEETAGMTKLGVFIRDDSARNKARTRLLNGWNFKAQSAPRMVVRSVRLDHLRSMFRCSSLELMQAAPVGSVINSGSSYYMKLVEPSTIDARCWGEIREFNTSAEHPLNTTPTYAHSAFTPGLRCTFGFTRFGPRDEGSTQ